MGKNIVKLTGAAAITALAISALPAQSADIETVSGNGQ